MTDDSNMDFSIANPRKKKDMIATEKVTASNRAGVLKAIGIDEDADVAVLSNEEVRFSLLMAETGFLREKSYRVAFDKKGGEHGMSTPTVYKYANKLMNKAGVKKLIRKATEKMMGDTLDNLDARLLMSYVNRAFYDVNDFYWSNGMPKELDEIDEAMRQVIDSIEVKYYGKDADVTSVVYKLPNREAALKVLMEYVSELRDPENVRGNLTEVVADHEDEDEIISSYENMDDDELAEELRRLGG